MLGAARVGARLDLSQIALRFQAKGNHHQKGHEPDDRE